MHWAAQQAKDKMQMVNGSYWLMVLIFSILSEHSKRFTQLASFTTHTSTFFYAPSM